MASLTTLANPGGCFYLTLGSLSLIVYQSSVIKQLNERTNKGEVDLYCQDLTILENKIQHCMLCEGQIDWILFLPRCNQASPDGTGISLLK